MTKLMSKVNTIWWNDPLIQDILAVLHLGESQQAVEEPPQFLKWHTRVRLTSWYHQSHLSSSLMNRVCIHVFWTRPSADSPPTGGQTKGSSSVIVPEASPLSIDLLSPNFSVTYALLNSHYCSHWSLIRENNRLVVTEGENMSQSVTAWVRTHDFSSRSPPGDLYAPRAGPFEY